MWTTICAKHFAAMSLRQHSSLVKRTTNYGNLWRMSRRGSSSYGDHKSIAIDSFVNESADD